MPVWSLININTLLKVVDLTFKVTTSCCENTDAEAVIVNNKVKTLVVDDYSFGIRVLTTRSGDFKCQVYDFEQRVDVNQRPNRSENSL